MNLIAYQAGMIRTRLDHILIGTPKPFGDDGEMSAIVKNIADRPLMLGVTGLEGNLVGDPLHHGGRDNLFIFIQSNIIRSGRKNIRMWMR